MTNDIDQRLETLRDFGTLYQEQLQAVIEAYQSNQPLEIQIEFLNEALILLNASTPKILILKDLIRESQVEKISQPTEG